MKRFKEEDGTYTIFFSHQNEAGIFFWYAEWRPFDFHNSNLVFITSDTTPQKAFKRLQKDVLAYTGKKRRIGFLQYLGLLTRQE